MLHNTPVVEMKKYLFFPPKYLCWPIPTIMLQLVKSNVYTYFRYGIIVTFKNMSRNALCVKIC